VVDGVFEALPDGVTFHAATGLDEAAFRQVQANVRKRILRAFVARGHLDAQDAKDMAARASSSSHGGGFYEVFPLICPMCGGQMRIIAFITFSADILKILDPIGVDTEAPRIAPARGPPQWDDCGAQATGEGVEAKPNWDMTSQSAPDYPDDQRTTW
jgi:hypothetical protein